MEGKALFTQVIEKLRLMEKMYRIPQELLLTPQAHKALFKYLQENPLARGLSREFHQIEYAGLTLDLIPVESIPVYDEDTGEIINHLDFDLK